MIQIISFRDNEKLLDEFVNLTRYIYKKDRDYIHPDYKNLKSIIIRQSRSKTIKSKHFIICNKGLCSGRVTAGYEKGSESGFIGYFEAKDQWFGRKLIDEAIKWLKSEGIDTIIGPLNYSTFHRYRFTTGEYKEKSFMMEPYNQPWYPSLFLEKGFKERHSYLSTITNDLNYETKKYRYNYEKSIKNGFKFRTIDKRNFEKDIRVLYNLSINIFNKNKLYREIPFEEFKLLYSGGRSIINEKLCLFLLSPDNREVGFIFGLPDYSRNLRYMKGEDGLLSKVRFLFGGVIKKRCICKTLGVLPAYRDTNSAKALLYLFFKNAIKSGFRESIMALVYRENVSVNFIKDHKIIREYKVYEYQNK